MDWYKKVFKTHVVIASLLFAFAQIGFAQINSAAEKPNPTTNSGDGFIYLGRDAVGAGVSTRAFSYRKAGIPDVYYRYTCDQAHSSGGTALERAEAAHKFLATPPNEVLTAYFINRDYRLQNQKIRRYSNSLIADQFGCRLVTLDVNPNLR